jgi:hypothetical protein
LAGDHDRWQGAILGLELLQKGDSTHPGQAGVDQKASLATRVIDVEKRLAVCECLDRPTLSLDHFAHGFSQGIVVIDQKDGRGELSSDWRSWSLIGQ